MLFASADYTAAGKTGADRNANEGMRFIRAALYEIDPRRGSSRWKSLRKTKSV
jgi:hypothetical protein